MKVHLAYSNDWSDGNEYIMGTASEVHTNALFDIYPNDTTITAEFKGNTQQNGTPTPSAPVPVVGVGDLDGTAYKIPVEIGLSTQSIDLSAVQSVRQIQKVVLTGEESFSNQYGESLFSINLVPLGKILVYQSLCTHYKYNPIQSRLNTSTVNGEFALQLQSMQTMLAFKDTNYTSVTDFQAYLQQQYINGTPVTIYYVLANPITNTVNEPLQKIDDYADSISNITLTTTAGAKSFEVDTAVKPSEITLNFRGWHPKNPKESTGGEWS